METMTNLEPARRNGPRESRKDNLVSVEIDHAISVVEDLIGTVNDSIDTIEDEFEDMAADIEPAGDVTGNRR